MGKFGIFATELDRNDFIGLNLPIALAAGTLFAVSGCAPELAETGPDPEREERAEKARQELANLSSQKESGGSAVSQAVGNTQSSIYGLLVSPVDQVDFAGEATKMTATRILDLTSRERLKIRFNQKVGDSMSTAANEVEKFHRLRKEKHENGVGVEIGFAEKYSSKDGPSAAVACALLGESILTGVQLDPSFAVTGDLNADGKVQPVGGIDGKLRGAINSDLSIVAIPESGLKVLSDTAVLGDFETFRDVQIFSISTFEEALAIAEAEETRDPKITESLKIFEEVQGVLSQNGGERWLKNPHVHERLRKVVENTPNHQSARFLLLHGVGQAPESLSLAGSFLQIYRATKPLRAALDTGEIPEDTGGLSQSMFDLRRIRSKLDPRTRGCADALENFSSIVKRVGDTDLEKASSRIPKLVEDLNSSWDEVVSEYRKIQQNPEIQEELGL